MVDTAEIQAQLYRHFEIKGSVTIDPQTGLVDVFGPIRLDHEIKVSKLPVAFGRVTGSFVCNDNTLTTLEGSPVLCLGSFDCSNNNLHTLLGAPSRVKRNFHCFNNPQLKDLSHAPADVGDSFGISYADDLPLLRLLAYSQVELFLAPAAVKDIVKRYQGQGRNSSLACGAELARAGFKGNARW